MATPCRAICRVAFIASEEDLSVHIYEHGNPNGLLFADEDEPRDIGQLMRRVWRFIRTRDISGIDLHFLHDISYAFREELARWIGWLLKGGREPE